MSSSHINPTLAGSQENDVSGKKNVISEVRDDEQRHEDDGGMEHGEEMSKLEGKLVRKVDFRLCTIAGVLCSLNLLDSGIIS
jgi:hypothetical protein